MWESVGLCEHLWNSVGFPVGMGIEIPFLQQPCYFLVVFII